MGYFWTRRFSGLVVTALAIAASAGCGVSGNTASSSGSGGLEKTHLTVGALAVADDAPLYIAIKDGYFKQAGLDVTAVPVAQSTQAIPDMLRGSVDVIAGANYVSFFQAESKGVVKFKVLADGTHCQSGTFDVMALPGSGIKKPAGLAGKKVAVNLTDNVQTLTLNTVLKKDGVNPSSVQYVEVPFPDMVAALKAHRVDAISAIEPFITGSEQQDGARPVVSQCAGPTAGFPLSGYFATASWAQQYPRTAKAFAKALDKAQALADSDPSAVRKILPTYTKVTPGAAKALKLNTYPATLSPAALNQVASLMRSGGLLTKKLDVSSMMTP
ncbi:MAG: ABC transporter substrate-binding protein [Streptosporangiales bacterium]|nr:ABC transporter substrate-binding protein [Streptosporangiales bacterium]